MEFSTAFVALRDQMQAGQDKRFSSLQNHAVCSRTAALYSAFSLSEERKIMGIMPTGGFTHAHEHRLLFAVPSLTEDGLADWWNYAQTVLQTLVEPDAAHEFSIISLILACGEMDKGVVKRLKKLSFEKRYNKPQNGWASVRLAAVDLTERKVYTNHMGGILADVVKPWLQAANK